MFIVYLLVGIPAIAASVATWLLMPSGYAAAIWPLVLLAIAPTVLMVPAIVIYQLHARRMDKKEFSQLSVGAGEWLRLTAKSLGLDVKVEATDAKGDAYDPNTKTISLSEKNFSEHTVRSRTVAAHELGHAIADHQTPRVERLLLWGRSWSAPILFAGLGVLAGSALVAVPGAHAIGFALLAAAALMGVGTLVSEARASAHARELLGLDPELSAPAKRAGSTRLSLAFVTYALDVVLMTAPLLLWDKLTAVLGSGTVLPTPAIAGAWAWLAGALAIAVLVITAFALLLCLADQADIVASDLGGLVRLAGFLVAPIWVFSIAGQASVLVSAWVLIPAGLVAFHHVIIPAQMPVTIVVAKLAKGIRNIAPATRFTSPAQLRSSRRKSPPRRRRPRDRYRGRSDQEILLSEAKEKAERELELAKRRSSLFRRLWAWKHILLLVPLALAYLGWL